MWGKFQEKSEISINFEKMKFSVPEIIFKIRSEMLSQPLKRWAPIGQTLGIFGGKKRTFS